MMVQIDQSTINILIGLLFSGLGYWAKTLQTSIANLQKGDLELTEKIHETTSELTRKVSEIEILVHGKYVTRDELKELQVALFGKLDRIEERKSTMQASLEALFTKLDKIKGIEY